MITVIEKTNIEEIIRQYKSLENDIKWTEFKKGKQASLQFKDTEDPWTSSIGVSRGHERSFYHVNLFFKNTIFEDVILKFNLTRSRLMWINPGSCYSMHTDETQRIHIPIITNDQSFVVFKEGLVSHIPIGHVYLVDTTKEHTVMNCSMSEPRLHFVGATKFKCGEKATF
jgi:hypothetical protein